MSKKISDTTYDRTFTIEPVGGERAEGEPLRFKASLSSDRPVARWFGDEILIHEKGAINMERADRGLPFLFNHDVDKPIGRMDSFKLDGNKLRGEVELDPDDELAQKLGRKIERGHLTDLSVRYSIDAYERHDDDEGNSTYRVTKWTPLEASLATVPADADVGVGRNFEGKTMTDTATNKGDSGSAGGAVKIADFEAARAAAIGEGEVLGAQRERERIAGVNELFAGCRHKGAAYDALRDHCIAQGSTVDQARAAVFELMNREPDAGAAMPNSGQPTTSTPSPDVRAGADEGEKLIEGAQRVLDVRCKITTDKDAIREMRESEFASFTMVEMAREFLRRSGVDCAGFSRADLIGYALRPDLIPGGRRDLVGHGPSAFANLLANTANKRLQIGFDEAPETWSAWTRTGTLVDFKQQDRPALSNFGSLDEIPPGGEYKAGSMSDLVEYITAKKYGKKFGIYREALINDDLDGLSRAPAAMGRAASRTIGDLVYAKLTSPDTLNQDSLTTFDAGHNNTGTAGTPSVTTLDEAGKLMALQSDPSDSAHGLNITGAYLIVPVALKVTAQVLMASQFDPKGLTGATGGATAPNPFQSAMTVIADPRLDADSSTAWYIAADPGQFETIEVGFVNGQQEPALESQEGWNVDGIEYKTRIEVGVSTLDFRGLFKNAGA